MELERSAASLKPSPEIAIPDRLLAHNFGHGKKYLARTFATMNLLAFAFHTACDCLETLWQQAREAIETRARFFQELHIISAYLVFSSWTSLIIILVSGKAPPI